MPNQDSLSVTPIGYQRCCAWCNEPLKQKPGESRSIWEARRFCDRAHYFEWKRGKPNTATVEGRPIRIKPRPVSDSGWTPFRVGALLARVCKTDADWAEVQRGLRLVRQMMANAS